MKEKPKYFTGENALTKEQLDTLFKVANSTEDKLLLMIGAGLGIRRYDMSRIIVRNINFDDHTITYLEKKKRDAPHTAPMPDKLEQELKIYIKEKKLGVNDRIFSVRDRQLCNRWYKMLDQAKISRRGIHSLRGTCVKLCQMNNWSVEQTAKLVNDLVSTIQVHYATPSASEMKDVMMKKGVI